MTEARPSPATRISGARAIVRLARPLFLLGGLAFNALGASSALAAGYRVDPISFLLAQGAITATQLVTHFSNEYYDRDADRATRIITPWSGGSRVLPFGALAPEIALRASWASAAVAFFCGAALALRPGTGWAVLPLLIGSLALAWSYSSPPLGLHGRRLGEVFGALLLAGLTPLFGYYAHAGWPGGHEVALAMPLIALQFAMLVTVSLPDVEGDEAVGKVTLAVWLGRETAAKVAAVATLTALLAPLVWQGMGLPILVLVALLGWLPLGVWQAARLWRLGPAPDWSSLGFWSVGLVMGPVVTLSAALVWMAVGPETLVWIRANQRGGSQRT